MSKIGFKRYLGVALAALALAGAPPHAAEASNATVQSTTYQTVKGWGGFVFIYNTPPTNAADAVYNMGVTVSRFEIRPELYTGNNSFDPTALSIIESWVRISLNHGVNAYTLHVWSPPGPFKTGGDVNTGSLATSHEGDYVTYYTNVIKRFQADGLGLPVAISIQNEPNVNSPGYYSCYYSDPIQWQRVAKAMRASFDSNGLGGVKIFGPETSGYCWTTSGCPINYMGGPGYTALNDATLNNALGAYALHSYENCNIPEVQQGFAAHPKEAWETEFSVPGGTTETDWTVNAMRVMMADMEALPFNYWMWWAIWDPSVTTPSAYSLIAQNGTTVVYSKRYYAFQKVWKTVTNGWVVKHMTTDDPDLKVDTVGQANCSARVDMLGFENPGGSGSAVMIANPTTNSKTITVNGLRGSTATFFRSSSSEDMAQVSSGGMSGSYTITLPADTVGLVVTTGSGNPPPAPGGLTATAGNAQIALTWNASSGATNYNVKRSTTSGSGYATVGSTSSTSFTNTGLTNGIAYYFVVTALNAGGESGNSNQASATPSGPPPVPSGLSVIAGNTLAVLSWTTSSGATSYNAKRSTVNGSGYATVSSPTSTSFTNTGLSNGTTYYYIVTAVNANGESGSSSQVSATPQAAALPIKINCAGPAVSPFIADTDFSGGSTATNWTGTIDTSGVSNPAPQAVYQSERFGAMTYTIPFLASGASFTVRLHFCENYFTVSGQRTFNVSINGTQVLSNFDIFATAGAIHKANIQQFSATSNGSGQIVITFSNVVNNGLVNGIEVLSAGGSPPPAPTGLTATAGNGQVALSWTASSGATSYNVLRSTVSGSGYASVATGISTTSYTNTGLTNGTTYYFVVTATNSSGTSGNSNQASATPSGGGGLVQINAGGPAVSPFVSDVDFGTGTKTFSVSNTITTTGVTNPAPMAVYQTERASDGSNGGVFSYTIPGLTANAPYTVRLHFAEIWYSTGGNRSISVTLNGTQVLTNYDIFNAAGGEFKANVQQFSTNANGSGQIAIVFGGGGAKVDGIEVLTSGGSIPPAPTGLAATAGNAQVTLTWNASTGATSYNVLRSTVNGSGYASVATGISPTSYTNTGLTNGTTYYFVVTATNSSGTSGNSNQASATPTSTLTPVIQIACGNASGVSPFIADTDFGTGTKTYSVTNTISTSGVTNAAPMAVYQSERASDGSNGGAFTYTIPGLSANTAYTVRLHFAEIFYNTAGNRTMTVTINGTQVLTNYDIFTAAGGEFKANVQQFSTNANGSGQIAIVFGGGGAKIDGIEVLH